MVLLLLILVLAAVGGFLGDFLQLAGWLIFTFAAVGAIGAWLLYRWFDRLRSQPHD